MKVTSKKWRTGCLGLVGLIGVCGLLSRLPKPPTTATQAQRQGAVVPLVAVNTPAPTFTRSAMVVTETPLPTLPATETPAPLPTLTPEPIDTLAPTDTPAPLPTDTEAPTATPVPLPTDTDVPTDVPTELPVPTDTSIPLATDVPTIAALAPSVGNDQPFVCNGGCTEPPAGSNCVIKGNVNSKKEKIYHTPGDRDYERTDIKPEEGDRWFCTEDEARAAGFRAPRTP